MSNASSSSPPLNYLDRNTIANLLQLSLQQQQQDPLTHDQPIILSTSCYHIINQIIDQLIYEILKHISTHQQTTLLLDHHLISLPIQPACLKTNGICKVFKPSLANQSIHAAELAWMVYKNKLTTTSTQHFSSNYSLKTTTPSQSIPLDDIFLQLQIDCQILTPYTSHQPWLKPPSISCNTSSSVQLFNQSLDLLLDPYYFDHLLERYDSLYHTVNLSLRQQQQQQQQNSRPYHKPQSTILQDKLVIYFLGVIQAFTNYLIQVIIAIVNTRLPYPSPIQAHHLIAHMAQDDQIINLLSLLETVQARTCSLLPHSPLSPFYLVEPVSHHQKSSSLKPLILLTPTMINKLGPASHHHHHPHSLNQIIPLHNSTSTCFNPLHSPFLPFSTRPRRQTASLSSNTGTISPARLDKIISSLSDKSSPFQSFHSFSPPLHSTTSSSTTSTHKQLVSHRSLTSLHSSSLPNTPHTIHYHTPDLSLHPLPSVAPFNNSIIGHSITNHGPQTPISYPSSEYSLHSPLLTDLDSSKRVPINSNNRKPVSSGNPLLLLPTPPIASPGESQDLWRPPRAHDIILNLTPGHHGNDHEKVIIASFPSHSHRLPSITPYPPSLHSISSSSITSPRSTRTNPLNSSHHQSSQVLHNLPNMRHPSDFPLPHHRSKSLTATSSPMLGQPIPSLNSHVAVMDSPPKFVKSHKKGHSVAQPTGISQRISFEQLMRSNATVKFSLTPGPCLDASDSPESHPSSDCLSCSPDKLDAISSDPVEMLFPESQVSAQLLPRSELLPRSRYQSQFFADTTPQSQELRKFDDQVSSPSSNFSSSRSLSSQHNTSPPGSLSSKKNMAGNMSSMSQRIAASRTPSSSNDFTRKQPPLQSLAEILNSDPPWVTGSKNKKSFKRISQSLDASSAVGALGLSTAHSARPNAQASTLTVSSVASDSSKSQRYPQVTKSSGGINIIQQSPIRPQPAEASSGLQKKFRGLKSLMSRRTKVKEEPSNLLILKPHQPTAVETDSRSAFSLIGEPRDLPASTQQPINSRVEPDVVPSKNNHPSVEADETWKVTPCDESVAPFNNQSTYRSSITPPSWQGVQSDLTVDINPSMEPVQENRSRLRRSMSLSSHIRRPLTRDSEQGFALSDQPLKRTRSFKTSKSRTLTENSSSSGASGGTITDERGLPKSTPGEQSDLDDIIALASRLNRRFRGPFDPRRDGSSDSLPNRVPSSNFASKQRRERQETGSSVEDNFEISFAQELKPTTVNRIILTSPTKKINTTYNKSSDENLLLSYYDSSSQSTAIDDESSNFKVDLFDKTSEQSRSQKSSGGPEEQEGGISRDPQFSTREDGDEYVSLDGLKQMVSELNAIVDQLSKPTATDQHPSVRATGLGIKRVDLLKMLTNQV